MSAHPVLPPLDASAPDRHTGQGERALWSAVVRCALDDLDYEPLDSTLYAQAAALYAQAAAFFLSGGEWRASRTEIADMLGCHADDLRRCGLRHIAARRHAAGLPPLPPEPRPLPCPVPPLRLVRLEATYLPKTKRGRPKTGWRDRNGGVNPFKFDPWREIGDAAD